ncbi:glycosyltransferase family 2 protein [Flectobacillus roseus]|uniref:Glycosyltransferase family 2 protein n=1 Tax=Flectobacillus roseus TaxID=502259 RepID=A0ABT6YF28_9BACT|nr:glycosyltransferase family 2 protein [Flectobacillus roseus]MDI9862205.1 glycosyltransferase family 2 protein [Flectobacillus roseus]
MDSSLLNRKGTQVESKVGIVVLNYNTWEDTLECLGSLLKLDYLNYSIVIVDNDSKNDSMERILQWANGYFSIFLTKESSYKEYSIPSLYDITSNEVTGGKYYTKEVILDENKKVTLTFINSGINGGYAAGNNIGIQYLLDRGDTDFFWILNNDTVVDSNALNNTFDTIYQLESQGNKLGIFGHRLTYYFTPDTFQASFYLYNKFLATTRPVVDISNNYILLDLERAYPTGASIIVSKQFIKEVGLMSEDYFLYFEEPDWAFRANVKGFKLLIINNACIFHKEGGAAGSNADVNKKSKLSDLYSLRNRLVITKKFFPKNTFSVKLGLFVALLNRIKRRQFNRALFIMKLIFSKSPYQKINLK